jgi:protein TonB
MRRALLASALAHAAVLAVAWHVGWIPGAPAREGACLVVVPEAEAAPPERFPAPDPPPPPPAPAEEAAPLPADEPEPDACAFPDLAEAWGTAPRRDPPLVRLPSPLPRRAPAASAPPASAPRPSPPPARPRGETRGPRLLAEPDAPLVAYPEPARRRGLEGRLLLRVRIDSRGAVTAVEVIESSGHAILDRAACDAAWGWTFAPALRDGAPVASEFVQAVRFRLRARGVPASARG